MDDHKDIIIENICTYAESHDIKGLLNEYMKRIILNKPDDVVAFLIETIEKHPYVKK
jgi:HEPN domain-containing protein